MLRDAYEKMLATLGPQGWWPAESAFEVIVGAVLTQNTSWANVERALDNLRAHQLLTLHAISEISHEELAETIRPAGYYRLKARRLKNLVEFVVQEYDADLEWMFQHATDDLRQQLLGVNGIGPETADSILLYAGNKPVFVVDAYTARILKRHGWIEPEADYYAIQELFHLELETDQQLFNEYHALIVIVGHHYCRPKPKCEECPLCDLLPESGIVEVKS